MRHLEPTRDQFVEDKSGERLGDPKVDVVRRLLTIHLELDKPTVDFFEPTFVVGAKAFGPAARAMRYQASNSVPA